MADFAEIDIILSPNDVESKLIEINQFASELMANMKFVYFGKEDHLIDKVDDFEKANGLYKDGVSKKVTISIMGYRLNIV